MYNRQLKDVQWCQVADGPSKAVLAVCTIPFEVAVLAEASQ